MHTVALVNVTSSTMVRETHGSLPTYAGPEVAVASTKHSQRNCSTLLASANKIALEKGLIKDRALKQQKMSCLIVAEVLENSAH